MEKTDDIVTFSEGEGKGKIVYHYTEASIKKFVKDELILAVEAGEKSPFMRLLHLRKGNLNYVKKDCTDAILSKIEECKERVKTEKNIVINHIDGGYESTIKKIIDDTFNSLMTNVNFVKKMIKENPIQVIEMGLFKDFINTDDKIFILLFNSLLASDSPNAGKLADKLFNKYITNDIDKLLLVAKNPKAAKYVETILQGDQIASKVQYAKFAKTAAKYNPAILNSIAVNKLAPNDILSIIKMNYLSTPSVLNWLTYLDDKTAKRYLKIIINNSNKSIQIKLAEIKAIENENERKEKLEKFKTELKDYLAEFRDAAHNVADYIKNCELIALSREIEHKNLIASNKYQLNVEALNKSYTDLEKEESEKLEEVRRQKRIEAESTISLSDYNSLLYESMMELRYEKFLMDDSDTFKDVLKSKLKEIDEKYPKDVYPDNNKKLRKEAIKDTIKDLLKGIVKTKIAQKLHNARVSKYKKLADQLTEEKLSVIIEEKYSDLIKEFEIRYNDVLEDKKIEINEKKEKVERKRDQEFNRIKETQKKKSTKINENKDQLLETIESEENLGL